VNIFQRTDPSSNPGTIRLASPDQRREQLGLDRFVQPFIKISIASPDQIRHPDWTKGEVQEWRFFGEESGKGIKGGIFDENIFGKEGALVCKCERPPKGLTAYQCCPKCKRPWSPARVKRCGRIELAAKVAHPWFYLQRPNYIALALGDPTASKHAASKDSTPPKRPAQQSSTRHRPQSRFERVLAGRLAVVINRGSHANLHVGQILEPEEADELRRCAQSGSGFECGSGGDAIHRALAKLDLAAEVRRSEEHLAEERRKAEARLASAPSKAEARLAKARTKAEERLVNGRRKAEERLATRSGKAAEHPVEERRKVEVCLVKARSNMESRLAKMRWREEERLANAPRKEEERLARTGKWWKDRIALLQGFIKGHLRPEWMMLEVLPVAPVLVRQGRHPQPVPLGRITLRKLSKIRKDINDVEQRIAGLKPAELKKKAQLWDERIELYRENALTRSLESLNVVDPINELYREVIRTNEALLRAQQVRVVRDRVQSLEAKLQWCVNRLLGPRSSSLKAEREELFPAEKVDVEWQITKKRNAAAERGSDTVEQPSRNGEEPDGEQGAVEEAIDYKGLVKDAKKEQANRQQFSGEESPTFSDRFVDKDGRFRGNLLGKRVDFSARSVIVTEPELRLHQCGLPRGIAVALYWPFILAELGQTGKLRAWVALQRQLGNLKGCLPGESVCLTPWETDEDPPEPAGPQARQAFSYLKFFKDSQPLAPARHLDSLTLDALDAVVARRPLVLINRQPTLHRPSIQAFEVRLMDGETIRLHPLVCAGFNADFDGDSVAVHLPISEQAQQEARDLLMTRVNLLKPASGELLVTPSQDMVLGCFYLTCKPVEPDPQRPDRLPRRTQQEVLYLHDCSILKVHDWVRLAQNHGTAPLITTVGRVLFNELLPAGTEFVNKPVTKQILHDLLKEVFKQHGPGTLVEVVERMMRCGFTAATKAGISLAVDDLVAPDGKDSLVEATALKVEKLEEEIEQEREALESKPKKSAVAATASASSRRMDKRLANLWLGCMDQLKANMKKTLQGDLRYGRTNSLSLILDSGARGSAEQIVQLVGMRGVMVRQDNSFVRPAIRSSLREGLSIAEFLTSTVGGRKGLIDSAKRTADAGYLTRKLAHLMCDVLVTELDCGVTDRLQPRSTPQRPPIPEQAESSVLWCQTKDGVCAKCYGIRLHDAQPVRLGDAVGLIAAQSLGEPTTQLTLRTFHQGGSASGGAAIGAEDGLHQDITSAVGQLTSLLFQYPKRIREMEDMITVVFETQADRPSASPSGLTRYLREKLMAILVKVVWAVYDDSEVEINPKHVALVIREIFSTLTISDAGDTGLAVGSTIARLEFDEVNDRMVEAGLRPATGKLIADDVNNGERHIGKLLVAASFSHAVKHLAAAAVKGHTEHLTTIREKVMAGGLIPAGTGYPARTPVECNGGNG
jgi:DNA-directed RNA polymerase subunit beta'